MGQSPGINSDTIGGKGRGLREEAAGKSWWSDAKIGLSISPKGWEERVRERTRKPDAAVAGWECEGLGQTPSKAKAEAEGCPAGVRAVDAAPRRRRHGQAWPIPKMRPTGTMLSPP